MMAYARRWSSLRMPLAILLVLATLPLAMGVVAQGSASHPAHIHQGTCDNLGDIVVPLDNVSVGEAAQISGTPNPFTVELSQTVVDAPLADILGGEHSINIHESADNIQEYIACGEIGGPVRGTSLVIGLGELNASNYSGVAVLEEAEGGTLVTVFLVQAPAGDDAAADDATSAAPADDAADDAAPAGEATADAAADDAADDAAADDAASDSAPVDPAAGAPTEEAAAGAPADAPAADAPAGNVVTVDIRDFAFNPNPIQIAVGDTVTWTNSDAAPHTATGQNRDLLQSGTIPPGGSFSQTFTEPGEIPYFCEFHPNMSGMIIVQ